MSEEPKNVETAAPKKGRPAKAPEEPVNTIVDLGTPKIVVTKPEPAPVAEEPFISEQTKLEMAMGRKLLTGSK